MRISHPQRDRDEVLILYGRVAPVLKDEIKAGKINLTAIINTHQYVPRPQDGEESLTDCNPATVIMQEAITKW